MKVTYKILSIGLMILVISTGCIQGREIGPDNIDTEEKGIIAVEDNSEGIDMAQGNEENTDNIKSQITRDYFENLDKDSTLEDMISEIGQCGVYGSGIIYRVWQLEDGTEAFVEFDSQGRIASIYIVSKDKENELIYERAY